MQRALALGREFQRKIVQGAGLPQADGPLADRSLAHKVAILPRPMLRVPLPTAQVFAVEEYPRLGGRRLGFQIADEGDAEAGVVVTRVGRFAAAQRTAAAP